MSDSGEYSNVLMTVEPHDDWGWWAVVTIFDGEGEGRGWRKHCATIERARQVLDEAWEALTAPPSVVPPLD